MSRYVQLELDAVVARGLSRQALAQALAALELGVTVEQAAHPSDRVMLEGSLECAGEPVDLRLPAGTLDSVEDFGFVLAAQGGGRWALICGEYDRKLLETALVPKLRQQLALARVRQRAARAGVELEELRERDGSVRLRLRED